MTIGVATATVASASAVYGFLGKGKQAAGERRAANLNYAQDYNAAGSREVEIDQAASEDSLSALIAGAKARGRISAAAGSMGLSEGTTQSLSRGATFDIAREGAVDSLNYESQRRQVDRDLASSRLSRDSKVAANKKPSPLELAFGIAKAGLQGAGAYHSAGGKF